MSVAYTNDPRIPIDRGWAWMCLLGTFSNHMLNGGLVKSTGVILVELMDIFIVSAYVSWIPSLVYANFMISGAVASGFIIKYGQRAVSMTGGLLLLFGIGLNYFSTNFTSILIFYGIITGIASGLLFASSISIVSCYFKKRRAFASIMSTCGASTGQLIFPPMMRVLIDYYSIKGALLILGAICFNSFACSALFRPLSFYMRGSVPKVDSEQQSDDSIAHIGDSNVSKTNVASEEKTIPHILIDKKNEGDQPEMKSLQNIGAEVLPQEVRPRASSMGHYDKHLRRKHHLTIDHRNSGRISRSELFLVASITPFPSIQNLVVPPSGTSGQDIGSLEDKKDLSQTCCPAMPCRCNKITITALYDFSLLKNPSFLIILFTFCLGQFAVLSESIFLPAKAGELKIERTKAALLLSYAAVGEIVGRIVMGILTDLKVLRSHHLMAICSLANGAVSLWCPFATTYGGLVVFAVCFGVFGGAFFGMLPVLLADMLGIDKLNHGLGLVMFFTVFGLLLGPPFQGWLKDITGTFNWAYYTSGIACTVVTVILLLEPFAQRYLRKHYQDPTL